MDRLEIDLKGKLIVVRVNVQDAQGQFIARKYSVFGTPTFIFFDASGKEILRSIGVLDEAKIRASVP